MSREWAPGDVAMINDATSPDEPWQRALCVSAGVLGEARWVLADGVKVWGSVTDASALVVLNMKPREAEFVAHILEQTRHSWTLNLAEVLREFADPKPPKPAERPIVHAVMYRDYKIGSLCDSGAWGAATLFSMVTDDVTCPGCRNKLDGGTKGVTA